MTRWLDEDEQRTWRSFLATSELLYAALDRQLQRDAGITHASYIVLAMLSEAPDRSLRMSDLAVRANSSPSRLSHAVARLEERGWVRREPAPKDGRGTVAMLTDAGWTCWSPHRARARRPRSASTSSTGSPRSRCATSVRSARRSWTAWTQIG